MRIYWPRAVRQKLGDSGSRPPLGSGDWKRNLPALRSGFRFSLDIKLGFCSLAFDPARLLTTPYTFFNSSSLSFSISLLIRSFVVIDSSYLRASRNLHAVLLA